MLNKCEFTKQTLKYSIAGGNKEISNILKEKGHSFEKCLETSVKYHRYELTNLLDENYKCKPVPLPMSIFIITLMHFFTFWNMDIHLMKLM